MGRQLWRAGLYNWSKEYSAGFEFYGHVGEFRNMGQVREQSHYVMPVVNLKYLSIDPAIGLTVGSNRLVMKVNLSYPIG